jgi:hypothetical protein
MRVIRALLVALLASPIAAAAQTPDLTLTPFAQTLAAEAATFVDGDGRIGAPSDAAELINLTLRTRYPTEVGNSSDFYAIIHVVRWADPSGNRQKVEASNWYVYNPGADWTRAAFASGKRLYGVKRAWLLYVHLNVMTERLAGCLPPQEACTYRPRYEVFVKEKLPANAISAIQLATLFGELEADRSAVTSVWGGGPMQIDKPTSDVTIHAKLVVENETAALGDPIVFDNEGRHRWDVSIGVPTRSIKELEVDTTAATAAPAEIERQRLFALLNIYPVPLDLKAGGLLTIPHLVVGTALAKRPLDRILLAVGWGPVFANLYAGVLWVREPKELAPDRDYKPQFAFGVNLPIRAIAETLKKPAGR